MKVAAPLLWEAYDCWRLWYLPPKLVEFMRLLDYTVPLGGADTDIELHSLLKKIDQVDWDTVPPINSSRSLTRRRPYFSPGRSHSAAGDFVWFKPWTSALCSPSEARLSRQFGNQVPTPDVAPERAVDPRADDICPRPSAPNSPPPAARLLLLLPPTSPRQAIPKFCRLGKRCLPHHPHQFPKGAMAPWTSTAHCSALMALRAKLSKGFPSRIYESLLDSLPHFRRKNPWMPRPTDLPL